MNTATFEDKYEYIDKEPINNGGFGLIHRIKDKKTKTEYILKKINKIEQETFENELDFLKNVK